MIQWPYIGVWMNFWRNPHLKRTWFPIPQVAKCECSPADRFLAFLGRADEVREGFSQRMRWKHRRWKQCRGFTLGCCRPGGCGRGWNINRLNSNPQKYRKVKSYILTKVLVSHSSIIFYPFVCEVATAWLQTLKCQIHFHRFSHIFRHRDSVGWGMERAQGQLNQRGAGAVMCKTSSPVSVL